MLKIGDFSKLSQVSIKALRLYDRMGLLTPTHVDGTNGYRYYSASQLPRLNRILAFKDLGFSLEQIMQLLDDRISSAQIRGMLRLKQAELQQHIQGETARLARVAARLRQIEQEGNMPNYEVVLKKISPMNVASIREILPNYPAVGKLFKDLTDYLQQHGVKPIDNCAAIWHDAGYKETDVDGEAIEVIDKPLPESDRIKVYELSGWEQAACVIHHGSYNTIMESYNYLLTWIETNGYQIVGPNREIYIQGGPEQDNESYLTEIQFPVEKIG
ncbi:MAG: MerR family transcriptional regulator [Oscillatoriales cyanobacterium RU_3_3]|nr:MerR family transcriptional regulator [Microcoleus sp. SU_5_6]NJL69374.1 MerR family transcriptional regulator [Microcoleus sp. SM1_3_4]NJM62326.1 MerR family transcriptional regulator [Oscillatoriales cyanobacterium RU_3_3]NJR26336.1 MerR family transcriptional regulator [Richelia sp. CSU_2_1]